MTKINLPDNSYILYALAGANAIGFAWASIAIEVGNTGLLMSLIFALRGVLMGLAAGFGMASISNKIPRASKAAKTWGYLGLSIIGLSAPVMMSPVIYARVSGVLLSALPAWVHISIAVASGLLVDGLILGIGATSGKLQAEDSDSKPGSSVSIAKPKQDKPAFVCSTCGYVAKSQAALSGHGVKHSRVKAEPSGYVMEIKPMEKQK
jgi:hypothetical protein